MAESSNYDYLFKVRVTSETQEIFTSGDLRPFTGRSDWRLWSREIVRGRLFAAQSERR